MTFPTGWPPRPASSHRSTRFYFEGSTTDNFSDRAFLFGDTAAKAMVDPVPTVIPSDPAPVTHIGTSQRPGSPMGLSNTTPDSALSGGIVPVSYRHAHTIVICNDDGANDLFFTFDDTSDVGAGAGIHGRVKKGQTLEMRFRHEAGIAVKSASAGNAAAFRIFAW